MNTHIRTVLIALSLLVAGAVSGCKGLQLRKSGFLSDYTNLVKDSDDRLMYMNPRIERGTYHRFIVEPVAVSLEKDREGDFNPEEIEEIAEYFYAAVIEHIAEHHSVVTRPAPGVGKLRISLTDIATSTPLLNIIPHTRLTGAGRGGAAFEAEVVDSMTGVQVAAVVRKAKQGVFAGGGMSKMSDAKRAIDQWADDFQENIEAWPSFEGEN